LTDSEGRAGAGWGLGFLLGPLGLIIVLLLPANAEKVEAEAVASGTMRKCPFCAEMVKAEAIVCKHCGKDLPVIEKIEVPIEPEHWACTSCKASNENKFNVCQACGAGR